MSVLLNSGSGSFSAAAGSPFAVGSTPNAVTVADVNGDGIPDILTANSSNSVGVMLGTGGGSFTAAAGSPFPVGEGPNAVAVADVNGDGKPDIVTANLASYDVSVLLGSGSGSVSPDAGSPFTANGLPFRAGQSEDVNGRRQAGHTAVINISGNLSVLSNGAAAQAGPVYTLPTIARFSSTGVSGTELDIVGTPRLFRVAVVRLGHDRAQPCRQAS